MSETKDTTVAIKRRVFGGAIEYSRVPSEDFKEYKTKGWVHNHEPLPEPKAPDIEVLELLHKDSKAALAKAEQDSKKIMNRAQADESNARLRLETAVHSIDLEGQVQIAMQQESDRQDARERVFKMLHASMKAVPARIIVGLGRNAFQQNYIRQTFVTQDNSVGKDDAGDWLITLNKQNYLDNLAAEKAKEDAQKEQAIRDRIKEAA